MRQYSEASLELRLHNSLGQNPRLNSYRAFVLYSSRQPAKIPISATSSLLPGMFTGVDNACS